MARTGHRLLLLGLAAATLGSDCKCGAGDPAAHPEVAAFLMPPGRRAVELRVGRTLTRPSGKVQRTNRRLAIQRSVGGVYYRVREQVDQTTWRLAAQLNIVARPDGAYLKEQFGLGGKRVGVKGRRLLFPWPLKAGVTRQVRYAIHDGRTATATVTLSRHGFSRAVGGKTYKPCLETREAFRFNRGGRLVLRQIFCKGLGRVEIETVKDHPRKGRTRIVDRTLAIQSTAK
jgi:hypothetical protein